MKNRLVTLMAVLLAALLTLSCFALAEEAPAAQAAEAATEAAEAPAAEAATEADEADEEAFPLWNADAPALKALVEYVEDVTDEASPNYIPPVDRIATFDMDGTLCAELNPTYLEYYLLARRILADPSYHPDTEMLEFGRMLRDHALDRSFPDGMDLLHANHAAKAYAGMTLNEFADFVTRQLVREADGFENMTYAETFYQPMIEVVEYLQANGFKCYIVSGSDRFICRTYVEGVLDIPYENIIGMDVQLEATNQGDLQQQRHADPHRQPGHQEPEDQQGAADRPGDWPSAGAVLRQFRRRYRHAQLHHLPQPLQERGLHADRRRRGARLRQRREGAAPEGEVGGIRLPRDLHGQRPGYHVISMANDWKTIYGEDVVKTNEFHWLDDLAEDIVPIDEPVPAAEADVQYVMYLGTNDKDSGKPVFTQAESMEQAKAILIKHFGGYTIQDAEGGWIDDDKVYQEYTLVIYLSDTTEEAVHAAADELVQVFNQSSVLIQKNPTTTEFYAGAGN